MNWYVLLNINELSQTKYSPYFHITPEGIQYHDQPGFPRPSTSTVDLPEAVARQDEPVVQTPTSHRRPSRPVTPISLFISSTPASPADFGDLSSRIQTPRTAPPSHGSSPISAQVLTPIVTDFAQSLEAHVLLKSMNQASPHPGKVLGGLIPSPDQFRKLFAQSGSLLNTLPTDLQASLRPKMWANPIQN